MKKEIKGLVVLDLNNRQYKFVQGFDKNWFVDGIYQTEYCNFLMITEHIVEFDLPEQIDTITPQVKNLDRQEEELNSKYKQAVHHIQVQRNNLLAIEG